MILAEQIIDTVLRCHNSIRRGRADRAVAFEAFYSEIRDLFQNNRDRFDADSFSLLEPDDFSTCPEETVIRLECAGIYHKNGLDVYFFRMRYYLNLAADRDDALFVKKISSAFSMKGKVGFESFDARSPYEKLLLDVISKKEPCCAALETVINRFVANQWEPDFDNLIPYVQVSRILGRETSQNLEMVFLVLTEIPTMLGDGLCTWITNNPDYKKKLSRLAAALEKIGMAAEGQTIRSVAKKLPEDSNSERMDAWADLENEIAENIDERKVLADARMFYTEITEKPE